MTTVYICVGSTGEYSDHREWYVKAFADEEKCKRFVEAVSAEYRKICTPGFSYWQFSTLRNRLDPNMKIDSTGTNYFMVSVPFEE